MSAAIKESKHTPGPWTVAYPLRSSERPRIKTADKQEIAIVAKVHGGTTELTYNCNAKLIAAAPEMAEALRGLLYAFRECVGRAAFADFEASNHDVIAARAALAKAGL